MLEKKEEIGQILLNIKHDLNEERIRLNKVRDNLDKIEKEHHIVIVHLLDRKH